MSQVLKETSEATKKKYQDIIVTAIFTLNERNGSARNQIWKFVQMKYQDTIRDRKIFFTHLKRAADEEQYVFSPDKKMGRFKLTKKFRDFIMKKVMKGETELNLKKMHDMLKPTKQKDTKLTKVKTLKKNKDNKSKKGKDTRKKTDDKKADAKVSKR